MPEYDVAIVGGGSAGLVAARYCLHAHLHTAIITPDLGGKVNYPFALRATEQVDTVWGAQIVHEFEDYVRSSPRGKHIEVSAMRVEQIGGRSFRLLLADGETVSAHTVIISTGAAPQRLHVAGEMEYWGRGVSFSAISHASLFHGRNVAIVGSGRRGVLAALELAPIAGHVYFVVARRQVMIDLPEAELLRRHQNVTVFSDWEVQAVLGEDYVSHIQLVGANGETRSLAVDGVFMQFDLMPNSELVRDLAHLDSEGHISINHRCETNVPGLFAAGDVSDIHAEQVLIAMGEGAKAALSAWEYLATLERQTQ